MESQPQNPEFRINPENFHSHKYLLSILSAVAVMQAVVVIKNTTKLGIGSILNIEIFSVPKSEFFSDLILPTQLLKTVDQCLS